MDCLGEEVNSQDFRLNEVYGFLKVSLNDADWIKLRNEQRDWLAREDSDCVLDKDGGTSEMMEYKLCVLKRLASRATELENLLLKEHGNG